LAVS
jgi:hypothetical protein